MATYKYDIDRHVNPAWEHTDAFLQDLFIRPDDALESALQSHKSEDMPAINVSPLNGTLLYQLASMQSQMGSRPVNILEIGTLAGYSTIFLGRAAKESGGRVTTLEYVDKHAQVARRNLEKAGLQDTVDVLVGDARELVQGLITDGKIYDFIFIDADKESYCDYWRAALKLSKKGTLIIADNVIRQGGIADPDNQDS
ncbi:hypothetical protein EMMF5_003246 [Cystobasidiomycetes sp. EMM_F5]